jgi:monovalent cation/hydrogen antiporter
MGIATKLVNVVLRRMWTGQWATKPCSHLHMIKDPRPVADVCAQCVARGDAWPALRMCLTCGHVGCCEKTLNKHALRHFEATSHPLVRPHQERGMNWIWCYVDKALLDPSPAVRPD